MTKPKKVECVMEFGSIFGQPKWLQNIRMNGFSTRRDKDNEKIIDEIWNLVEKYNNKTL